MKTGKERCNAYSKIRKASEDGSIGVVIDNHNQNKFHLCRVRKNNNVQCTGKEIDGKYVIVFWDNLTKQIGEANNDNNI
tara:strand:+ start:106 stop:342 length:237 start_codon:yes stop_codon:yes gene_type:complete